ncbi:MAG TPA: hypothetical protein VF116_19915 [Ktedonobacterales bacterium]
METTREAAAAALREVERERVASARNSVDNGAVLLVWGTIFLLDMLGFELSRRLGPVWPGVAFMCAVNAAAAGWRLWYARRLPIRLRRTLTNRVIFWWSWYYVALVGLGVGAWIVFVGPYPPLWLTLIGLLGALPLWIAGLRQRGRLRKMTLTATATEGTRHAHAAR